MIDSVINGLIRRLGSVLLTLTITAAIVVALASVAPGRSTDELLLDGRTAAGAARLAEARGETSTWASRFATWMGALAVGDLGDSWSYQRPVTGMVAERATNSLVLAAPAFLATWSLALPLGLVAAARAGRALDRGLQATLTAALTLPDIVVASLLLFAVVETGVFAAGGMSTVGAESGSWVMRLRDLWSHAAAPLACLILVGVPGATRTVRASVLDTLARPWAAAARARGVSDSRRLWVHALRLASAPIVTAAAVSAVSLAGGSLVVEVVFGWPGLGALLYQAALARDVPVVVGVVLATAVAVSTAAACADLAAAWLDPRVRPAWMTGAPRA
ncbi:MAG: ABC transporter permease [Vicinamibacterales bacterium]